MMDTITHWSRISQSHSYLRCGRILFLVGVPPFPFLVPSLSSTCGLLGPRWVFHQWLSGPQVGVPPVAFWALAGVPPVAFLAPGGSSVSP